MSQNFTNHDHILNGYLVEYVHIALIILVQDKSDVSAAELEVQTLLFLLLIGRLRVVSGYHKSQLSVVLPRSKFHENINEFRDFVLMENDLQFFGTDRYVKLDGYGLRVRTVHLALPATFVIALEKVRGRIFGTFGGH